MATICERCTNDMGCSLLSSARASSKFTQPEQVYGVIERNEYFVSCQQQDEIREFLGVQRVINQPAMTSTTVEQGESNPPGVDSANVFPPVNKKPPLPRIPGRAELLIASRANHSANKTMPAPPTDPSRRTETVLYRLPEAVRPTSMHTLVVPHSEITVNPEAESLSIGAFLGGMLALSGTMSLDGKNRPDPIIVFQDNDDRKMRALHGFLHPNTKLRTAGSRDTQSSRLVITSHEAVRYTNMLGDFAPSRLPAIEYFIWWEQATQEERKMKYEAFFQEHRQQPQVVSREVYMELLKNPYFFAGILFWRGRHFPHGTDGRQVDQRIGVGIASQNIPILEAIRSTYGGYGPIKNNGVTKEWRIEKDDYIQLMDRVSPTLSALNLL